MEPTKNDTPVKSIAFSEIYAVYFRRCYLYAHSYLRDVYLSEDVASEAMMKLWENWDETFSLVQRKAFLLTVIKNRCLDHLTHLQLSTQVRDDMTNILKRELAFRISILESTDPQELFVSDIQNIVNMTLKQLPPKTRLIFQLSRIENKTIKEIADSMGISTKSVEYHISKSLSILRNKLKDYLKD
ncbi:MAG: RNA polymerase sigma-70 factor [Tannerellaceae bacterium]|jgi:RNA polymerase sigma-70 factor (ECF subfamily)|nr:RNA polymerase sigma-70 factor [Tannerellaceae bacterium]